MKLVYFIRPVGASGPVKIGHSTYPGARLSVYRTWSPVPLEIVATLKVAGDDHARKRRCALLVEKRFHIKYAKQRLHHEWFAASDELLSDIAAINAGTFDLETLPPFLSAIDRAAA